MEFRQTKPQRSSASTTTAVLWKPPGSDASYFASTHSAFTIRSSDQFTLHGRGAPPMRALGRRGGTSGEGGCALALTSIKDAVALHRAVGGKRT
jgi:hypothetical protein